jgi:hypothetical protein
MICEVARTYIKKAHRQMRMKAMSTKARHISTFRSYRTTSSPIHSTSHGSFATAPDVLHHPPLPIPRQLRRASPLTTISPSRNAGPNPSPTKPTSATYRCRMPGPPLTPAPAFWARIYVSNSQF